MSGLASSSRLDKRVAVELRPLQLSLGQLDRADGSGRFGFGNSSALASVSGPLEVRLREEQPDKATFEILHRPLEGVGATPSRALIAALQAVLPPLLGLGQHPRSLVQLVVQSLSPAPFAYDSSMTTSFSTSSSNQKTWPKLAVEEENDSVEVQKDTTGLAPMTGMFFSSRAACLNASTLALLDAGSVSMRAVPIAVSIVYIRSKDGNAGHLLLDPSNKEELNASSRHLFAWAFGAGISASGEVAASSDGMDVDGDDGKGEAELVWSESEGEFSRAQLDEAMDQSKAAARKILSFIRSELSEHFAKRLKRD